MRIWYTLTGPLSIFYSSYWLLVFSFLFLAEGMYYMWEGIKNQKPKT